MYMYVAIALTCFNVPTFGRAVANPVLELFPEFVELKQQLVGLKTQVETLRSELGSTQTNKLGFSARLTNYISDTSAKIVVFDRVVTNVGDAYNTTTGIFTAPVEGLYLFSATLTTYNRYTLIDIYKNSNVVARVQAGGYSKGITMDQSTNPVIVELQKYDRVYVKLSGTAGSGSYVVSGEDYSSFSGVLVQ